MQYNLTQITEQFIQTLQSRNAAEDLIKFYREDIEQIEFPNTLIKNKTIRNLDDLKQPQKPVKKFYKRKNTKSSNRILLTTR